MAYTSPPLPLIKENLLLADQQQTDTRSFSLLLLERYCNDMSIGQSSTLRARNEPHCHYHNHIEQDLVLEASRTSLSPYNSDTHFLPSAEQGQCPLNHSRTSTSISSLSSSKSCGPRLYPAIQEPHTNPRRTVSAPPTHAQRQRQRQKRFRIQSTEDGARQSTPWLRKLVSLFKKKIVAQERIELSESCPVWYSHFAANPAPPPGITVCAVA